MISGILYWRAPNKEKRAVIVFGQPNKRDAKAKLLKRAKAVGFSTWRRKFRFYPDDKPVRLDKEIWG